MSRFNQTKKDSTLTVNVAGGEAYKESAELELVSTLLTSFVNDQYYKKAEDTINNVDQLIDQIADKTFVAKAAIYARNEFGMRSISHLVAASIANKVRGEEWTKRFFNRVVRRVDDITEILSVYMSKYTGTKNGKQRPIPNSLKKGLATAFGKFDEYQLAKYQAKDKEVSLVDAVNLLHPVPNERNRQALQKLVKDELRCTETWNSKLSEAGKADDKEAAKKQAWREFINKGEKIEYFALLRNLRNIHDQAPAELTGALNLLVNENLIKKSLVLPFRFQTAYDELSDLRCRNMMIALSKAAEISMNNVPKLPGRTLIVVDISGSMYGKPIKIASLFASVIYKANDDSEVMTFDRTARYVSLNPLTDVFTMASELNRCPGGSTDFHSIFKAADKAYDRIIILSDMQGWVGYSSPAGSFREYKKKFNCPECKIYSFNLNDYGTLMFPERNVYALAGFSDKIFDIMGLLEQDKQALIHKIKQVEL